MMHPFLLCKILCGVQSDDDSIQILDGLVRSDPSIYLDTSIRSVSAPSNARNYKPDAVALATEQGKSTHYKSMFSRKLMHDTASGQLHATIPYYFTAAIKTGGRFGKNLRQLLRHFALHRQPELVAGSYSF
jgi:hypothetical protein